MSYRGTLRVVPECKHPDVAVHRVEGGTWTVCGYCDLRRFTPRVPSMDERAAYFRRTGTSVAEQVGDGRPSLAARLTVRAGLAVYRGLAWVHEKLKARRARR